MSRDPDDASTEVAARAPARGVARRLLLVMGDGGVTSHPLPAHGEVVVGRAKESGVRVEHPSVSRSHVAIAVGDRVLIRDLGSANGTSLRGARLPGQRPIEIAPNEVFLVGDVPLVVQERRSGGERGAVSVAAPAPAAPAVAVAPIVLDPAMRNLNDLARRVAAGTISVLITGETGVGKEVLAEAIHAASPRAHGPLGRVNCAAIAESLIESELFGHERGAFTGALATKIGLIESASGGTIFLDEVGELSAGAQAKLLRVVEDRRVQRVGAVDGRPVDVRFVAATHRDLELDVAAGRFREDLYYRLAGVVLEIPPLRDRPAEHEPLVRAFVAAAAAQLGRAAPALTPAALAAIAAHPWPGNVRELRNAVERAVLLADREIGPAELFGTGPRTSASAPPADDEQRRIEAALEQCAGNQTRAAELLGIPRRTLVRRLAQYQIRRPKRG